MRTLSVLSAAIFAFLLIGPRSALADTIDFTITINSTPESDPAIPLGTVYSGFVQYAGSFAPGDSGYPPTLTSYSFNFPGSPASLSDLAFEFVQHQIGQPLFAELGYYDPGVVNGSYTLINQGFAVFTTYSTDFGEFNPTEAEYGTVQYTYVSDSATTPEPSSFLLLGTGTIVGFGFLKLRRHAQDTL